MGNFYVNHTICPADVPAIVQTLAGHDAFVSSPQNGCVVVFDKDADNLMPNASEDLAAKLSAGGKSVLAVLNHDDDLLMYWLVRDGKVVDAYNSDPDFGEVVEMPRPPEGGESKKLCEAFSCSDPSKVEEILRSHGSLTSDGKYEPGKYLLEHRRHEALAEALGLPKAAVALGYTYLEAGDMPKGLNASDFTRIRK